MKQKSFIRKWAKQKHNKSKHSSTFTPEELFGSIMYGLTSFARPDKRDKDFVLQYTGDSSLFEVGCYLYFRIDVWLFNNNPEYREIISSFFLEQFNDLFMQALKINNINSLIDERIDKYGELLREGDEIKQYHRLLIRLLKRTKNNASPQHYDFEKLPVLLDGIFEEMELSIIVVAFEKHIIPAIFSIIKRYFNYLEENNE